MKCGSIHVIDKDSLDVDTYSYERNMGDEVEYDFILQNREEIYKLSSRGFEELVAELLRQQRFEVELTPETRGGGCDIIATKNIMSHPFMLLIECKRKSCWG